MHVFKKDQIVENRIPNSKTFYVCRVIELMTLSDGSHGYRLVRSDDDTGASDKQLMARNKTWFAPSDNVFPHDSDCVYRHKDGLIYLG